MTPYLNTTQQTRRLLRLYRAASDEQRQRGRGWYHAANVALGTIADDSNLLLDTVCGICAALSPHVGWAVNLRDTAGVVTDDDYIPATFSANRYKALDIKHGNAPLDVLGGKKVRAFYRNLRAPNRTDVVTLDRHAARAALPAGANYERALKRVNERASIDAAYHRAAEIAGESVDGFQAIVWVAYRENVAGLSPE